MELIDYFIEQTSDTDQRENILKSMKDKLDQEFSDQIRKVTRNTIGMLYLSGKYRDIEVGTKMKIHSYNLLTFSSNLLNTLVQKLATKEITLLMIRKFLVFNSKGDNVLIKLHSKTGEFSIVSNLSIGSQQQQINSLRKLIQDLFQIYTNFLIKIVEKVLPMISLIYNQFDEDALQKLADEQKKQTKASIEFNNRISDYIKYSNQYAWTHLKPSSPVDNNIYKMMKEKLKPGPIKAEKLNKLANLIYRVSPTPLNTFQKLLQISVKQDDQLLAKHLKKIEIIKDTCQLQQLSIPRDLQEKLNKQGFAKINTSNGETEVKIEKFKKQLVTYQKELIKKLPRNEYSGIVKFYSNSNDKKQNQISLITTRVTQTLQNYIDKNSQTFSLFTILNFIDQICTSLKYLRDSSIVFHGLLANKLFLDKGIVKFKDFSNSVQYQVAPNKNLVIGEIILPTVIPYNNVQDQRSDVGSLGMLLYYLLYGKHYYNVKDSTLRQQKYEKADKNLKVEQRIRNIIISSQKQARYQNLSINLLNKLIFRSLTSNADGNLININKRPYLDWMIIILKSVKQNLLQQNYVPAQI